MRPELKLMLMNRMMHNEDNGDMSSNYNDMNRNGNYNNDGTYDRAYQDMNMDSNAARGIVFDGVARRMDRAMSKDMRRDMHKLFRLTPNDMEKWKRKLINTDGTVGAHFKPEQLTQIANKMQLSYNSYDEKDVCMVANMLYSDFGAVLRSVIPPEKEAYVYVAMAKAFLEDPDALKGSEKLATYYYCIVENE